MEKEIEIDKKIKVDTRPSIGICGICGKNIRPWGAYVKTKEEIFHGSCHIKSLTTPKKKK